MCAASGLRCIGAAYPAIRAAFSNGNNYGEQDWQGQANNFLGVCFLLEPYNRNFTDDYAD